MALNRRNKNINYGSGIENFGSILKQTREKHGINLDDVARELHVRQDILIAIENSDFAKIPPQGYSKNMVRSYSRLLGLNVNKITNMFLDSEYSYQVSKKRESYQKMQDENMRRVPQDSNTLSESRTPRQQIENNRANRQSKNIDNVSVGEQPNSFKRKFHTIRNPYKNTPRSRRELDLGGEIRRGHISTSTKDSTSKDLLYGDDYSSAHKRLEARMSANSSDKKSGFSKVARSPFVSNKKSGIKKRQVIGRYDATQFTDEENPNFIGKQQKPKPGYNFMNIYQNKNNAAQSRFSIPVVVAIVVVLLIILILVLFLAGKHNEDNKSDVSNLSVTGLTDPEKIDNSNTENNQASTPKEEPKDVEFKYKVKEGQTCYMEIYENHSSRPTLAREVKSGETNTFKVTDTLKVATTKPNAVEFFVGGNPIEVVDVNKTGVYTYTVDFKKYLEEWKKTNNVVGDTNSSPNTQSNNSNNNPGNTSNNSSGSSSNSKSSTKKTTH